MDSFSLKTKIVIGDGLGGLAEGLNRVFVVTDRFMATSGKVSYVTDRLEKHGAEYQVFSDVLADPDIDTVTKGVGIIMDYKPDAVVAFGGGSAIDAAKAAVYFGKRQAALNDVLFIAIPTTSGTGSEVTSFAVITDRDKGVKYPLIDDSLLPNVAILDAELTLSLPPKTTADTGMDVFTHAVEAFVSPGHDDFTDAMAEKAMRLVKKNLMTAYLQPQNKQARQGMHDASCIAGIAFNAAGLGLNHGMAHALGGTFRIPHGRANAILLPYVMSFNANVGGEATAVTERYARIAEILGFSTVNVRQAAKNLLQGIRRFEEKLHMPTTLRETGIDEKAFEEALPKISTAAIADRCTATNPKPCSEAEAEELFRRAYTGKL